MDKDYSEAALLNFLDYVSKKGLIKTATAKARKIAATKVLGALDSHEKLDLRSIDRASVFNRFVNKQGHGFTPDSLVTYKSRFNSSLDDFLRYVESPSAFRPGVLSRAARTPKENNESVKKGVSQGRNAPPSLDGLVNRQQPPGDPTKITFPVPIRPGVVVMISGLPDDLTNGEAQRIAAVITALAVPTTKEGA